MLASHGAAARSGGREVMDLGELLTFEWAVGADPVSIQEAGLRLALAIVLSGLVGIDRELKHKPLGLRTNMLVALGAASFSLMAMHLVDVLGSGPTEIQIDPGRVMEAIVGAIGFLGAAAIIQGRFELFGATTGASIWVVGAIGMACGFGFYALALAVTVAGLFVLTVLGMFTGRGSRKPDDRPGSHHDESHNK
jgi:putative Mg2+ transporter-C (MgtC) family protein